MLQVAHLGKIHPQYHRRQQNMRYAVEIFYPTTAVDNTFSMTMTIGCATRQRRVPEGGIFRGRIPKVITQISIKTGKPIF